MSVERARLIVSFEKNNIKDIIGNRKANIYYISNKNNYAIIYCDKKEENNFVKLFKENNSIKSVSVSSERLDSFKF